MVKICLPLPVYNDEVMENYYSGKEHAARSLLLYAFQYMRGVSIYKLCIIFQAGEMVRKGKDGALHLRQIRHYIETGAYLASVHLTEKNGIRKSAKKFVIEGICHFHNLWLCAMS